MRLLVIVLTIFLSPLTWAGNIEINYANSEKYLDIDSGKDIQSRFTERMMAAMTESFTEVASKLPESYLLRINVTDIDLAGDTRFGMGDLWQVRIMKDLYRPMLEFDVVVLDGDKIVTERSERLVDHSYLQRGLINQSRQFGYEQHMIERWGKKFAKTFN